VIIVGHAIDKIYFVADDRRVNLLYDGWRFSETDVILWPAIRLRRINRVILQQSNQTFVFDTASKAGIGGIEIAFIKL